MLAKSNQNSSRRICFDKRLESEIKEDSMFLWEEINDVAMREAMGKITAREVCTATTD